jgi:glycyl-tRNA synthetase
MNSSRNKIPFGIAQMGKAFRNEINPRHFTFRSREFEQMELEFFIRPGTDEVWHRYWIDRRLKWYESIGLPRESLKLDVHPKEKLAHYASACTDIQFDFTFGTEELEGIAARGDYDLSQHAKASGKSMAWFDDSTRERFIPHVIEPSAGVDRILLALISHAYTEETVPGKKGKDETRTVLKLHPRVAPVKAAVFPLLRNNPALVERAGRIFRNLANEFTVQWDDRGNIGKRYRYQDEMGTPFCITIDFDTLGKEENKALEGTVTVRDRDTMEQVRVHENELVSFLHEKIDG